MKSIGTTLLRVQIVGAALLLLIAGVAIVSSQRVYADADAHSLMDLKSASAHRVADLITQNRLAEATLMLRDATAVRDAIAGRNSAVSRELATLRHLIGTGPGARRIGLLEREWHDYAAEQRRMLAFVAAGQGTEAEALFEGVLGARYGAIDTTARQIRSDLTRTAQSSDLDVRNHSGLVMGIVLAVSAFGILLIVVIYRYVRYHIVDVLVAITNALADLASGDLAVVVSGGDRQDEIGRMVRALEVFRAQANQLERNHLAAIEAQTRAEALARHDALTGLPNRRLFLEALSVVAQTPDQPAAVLLIDLDRFKPINDSYGHEAGDAVLCELARRFVAHGDELGTVARLGGDEFAVTFPSSATPSHAARIAQLVTLIVSQPVNLGTVSVDVGATIGIALFPRDGTDPATLLHAADLAMYAAKAAPGCRYQFFKPAMDQDVRDRALLRADLRRAVDADEFRPHYQPLVTIECGDLVGFEILARWYHPTRGIIMPDSFIDHADELGLLGEITHRIMRQACMDARHWPADLGLSFNLAPSQIRDPSLESQLMATLSEGGIAPHRIEIEITENALISDLPDTQKVLAALQSHGITIALDDFGTGFASLNHLRDLRFDKIKIDRSFMGRLEQGGKNAEIVHAIIALSRVLGMTSTAEGIEDADQWAQLAEWGCDLGQGYLFGKGMSAEHAGALILTHNRDAEARRADGDSRSRVTRASQA